MALLEIREFGKDDILLKKCKPVKELTPRLKTLIEDMYETMYHAEGVGLAAPQVGVLRRICVIDVGIGEGDDMKPYPVTLINPEILETSGEQTGNEGCLSVPGKTGVVTRPNYAKVKAYNENMEEVIVEGEGLMARAILHEIDHLDGHVYVEKVEGELQNVEDLLEENNENEAN